MNVIQKRVMVVLSLYQGNKPLPPLTAVDVPFFYHCNPKYDPDEGRALIDKDSDYREKLDNTYGYMLEASPYCTNQYGQLVTENPTKSGDFSKFPSSAPTDLKKLSGGHAIVYHTSTWERIFGRNGDWTDAFEFLIHGFADQHTSCTFQKGGTLFDITGEGDAQGFFRLIGYYRFNSSIGKVQLCVAAPYTLFPVKVGCTYVPPPVNLVDVPNLAVGEGTRCEYFSNGRTDLKPLVYT